METIVREIVQNLLNKYQSKSRIRTLHFVEDVLKELKSRGVELDEDKEIQVRTMVIDILWEMFRNGDIVFDDNLLYFEIKKK